MSAREAIIEEMQDIAALQNKRLANLSDDLPLLDSGLDSLGFAILVARLEDRLQTDPFARTGSVNLPNTIGELIAFYDETLV